MNKNLDDRLKDLLTSELDTVEMTEHTDRRMLAGIHQQIQERSNIMKYPKKRMIMVAAAAIVALGTITAIAAGKVVGLVTSTNRNEAIHSTVELAEDAQKQLGTKLYIPDALSDGLAFAEGQIVDVNGVDEAGNTITTYPELRAMYGANCEVSIVMYRPVAGVAESAQTFLREEEYNGIMLGANEYSYLFLPPDATPSEEDLKLEAEGKLSIGYGSSEEQRDIFKTVEWTIDGVNYMLDTFSDKSLDEMMGFAKAYLDGIK